MSRSPRTPRRRRLKILSPLTGELRSRVIRSSHVHLSEKLSATLKSARKAAELVAPDISVRVVDSRLVSMGLGWAVLEAARSLNEGVDLETVLQRLDQASERAVIYFSVDNLEHLHRTGRIGTATAAEEW